MYKILLSSMLLLTLNSFAADSSSGCGLGWSVAPKNSLVSSWTRAITNAMASNTLGMTSGTSGCAKHSIVINEKKGIHFVEANFQQLIIESAKGSGQYLNAFSEVVNFKGDIKTFGKIMQLNFTKIYSSQKTTPSEFYSNFKNVVINISNS